MNINKTTYIMIIIYAIVNVIIVGMLDKQVDKMQRQLDATSHLLLAHTELHKLNRSLEVGRNQLDLQYPIVPHRRH